MKSEGMVDVPRNEYPFRERRYTKIERKPNEGVAPPNKEIRKLVQDMKERHKKSTPQEIKAMLQHEGQEIPLAVIIGVLDGK